MCANFYPREEAENPGFCACAAAASWAERDGADYVGGGVLAGLKEKLE
jgi:hypothetical protein